MFSPKKNNFWASFGFILAFNLMLLNYAGGGDSDLSQSESSFLELKLLLKCLSILAICFVFGRREFLLRLNLPLITLFLLFAIIVAVRLVYYETRDLMFVNTLIALPLLVGFGPVSIRDFKRFDRLLLWMVLAWVFLDTFMWLSGSSLWLNNAFVGGVGNPSSYGFLVIYCYEVASLVIKDKRLRLVAKVGLVILVFLTEALMPILVLLTIIILKAFKNHRVFSFIILTPVFLVIFNYGSVLEHLPDTHWKYKAISVLGFLDTGDISETSLSVSTRLEFAEDVKILTSTLASFVVGNVNKTAYDSGDSQVISYLLSFGVPLSLLFGYSFLKIYLRAKNSDLEYYIIALLLIFLTNRILDYWPLPILIFLTINRINFEYRYNKQLLSSTS